MHPADRTFSTSCTDHMITATWTSKTGWTAPSLIPYGPLALQPHASVLHYSTSCFEGMKFYRGHDLKIRLFRPSLNTVRMLNSSARISLPAFPPAELQKLIETLVAVEGEKWLPKSRPGSFMYLRPTMIGTAPTLSVNKPNEVLLYIIACCFPDFNDPAATLGAHANANNNESPNGNSETKPRPGLKLLASKEDTIRAWPGGFGFAKVGANYGPSLLASDEAHLRGFNQILWLFGPDSEITEAGASNFFLVWKTREGRTQLVTAPLGDGIILAGVTRRSVLELARERIGGEELEVVERKICMWELEEAVNEGRLMEAFAAGTAVSSSFPPPPRKTPTAFSNSTLPLFPRLQYFIMPISLIHYRGTDLHIPFADDNYGSKLKQWLMDIMYGAESHEWGVVVQERSLIPSDLDE